jgi:hypothetical protein
METTAIKSDHLLDGSLEWLHRQTTEWLSDVEFWREELVFFYNVLRKQEFKPYFPMQEVAVLEKELVKISSEDVKALEATLNQHERKLSAIMQAMPPGNERDYRHEHRAIQSAMKNFEATMRGFKKSVFTLVRK